MEFFGDLGVGAAPADAAQRLDEASTIEVGFPMEFILESTAGFVHGPVAKDVDVRPVG